MNQDTRHRLRLIVGTVLVASSGVISLSSGVPTAIAPFSLPVVYLVLIAEEYLNYPGASNFTEAAAFLSCATIPPALVFLGWNKGIGRATENRIPVRSLLLYLFVAASSVPFLLRGIPYGLEYQGATHTYTVIIENAILALALLLLLISNRRRPLPWHPIGFNTVLFVWIMWCSFPWLGELI